MLINLSNHPSAQWQSNQQELAIKQFGSIVDMQFPEVLPEADQQFIENMALDYFSKITNILDECCNEPQPNAVHVQGEFTLTFQLVTLLKKSGIKCIASTSKRDVSEENGKKVITFKFIRFREY